MTTLVFLCTYIYIISPQFENNLPIENGNVISKIPAFLDVIELPFVLDKHILLDTEGVKVLTGLIDIHSPM